jgi:hypothetical protein
LLLSQGDIKRFLCFFLGGLFSCFFAAAAWRMQKTGQPKRRKSKKPMWHVAARSPPAPRISIEPRDRRSRRANPQPGFKIK